VKFGARLQAGRFTGSVKPGALVIAFTPFLLRLTFGS
jgi:hypothetical protein